MKHFYRLLTIFFAISLCLTGQAQDIRKKTDRQLEVSELYYDEGFYEKARETCHKLVKKAKFYKNDSLQTYLLSYLGKYQVAMGLFEKFELTADEILHLASEQRGEESKAYGQSLLNVANLYLQYSDVNKAEKYLQQAQSILKISETTSALDKSDNPADTYFEMQILVIRAKIAFERGMFEQLEELLPRLLKLEDERLFNKEFYFDEISGTFKQRKLTPSQMKRKETEYAQLLTMQADAYRLKGDYAKSDSLYKDAAKWIKQNLPKGLASILHTQSQLKLKIDKGESIEEIKQGMEKNLFLAERRLGLTHQAYLKIQEDLLDIYILSNYEKIGSKQLWEIKTNTRLYYGKDQLQFGMAQRIEAKRDFYNRYTHVAQKNLEKLDKDSIKIPVNHIEKSKILELLTQTSLTHDEIEEAENYFKRLISTYEKVLGQKSSDYHFAKMELANFYLDYSNEFEQVKDILKTSFDGVIAKRYLPTSPQYVHCLNIYAKYYRLLDKFDSAKVYTIRSLEGVSQVVSQNHLRYAAELEDAINLDLDRGDYHEADSIINQMLDIFAKKYSRRTPFSLEYSKALETAARFYATMGVYSQANEYLLKARRLFAKSSKSANSSAVEQLSNLYIRTERYTEASRMLENAVALRTKRYGEGSRFLISPYNQLARLYLIDGNYAQADEYVRKALKIAQTTFGENSLKVIESLSVLADLYVAIGDAERARDYALQVVNIEKKIFGEKHIELANAYSQLGLIEYFNAEKQQAEMRFQDSEKIIAEVLGKETPIYANVAKNLGLIYLSDNRLEEATQSLNQAKDIWIKTLGGTENTQVASIISILGDVEMKRSSYDLALKNYKTAQKIYKKSFSKLHPQYIQSVAKISRANFGRNKIGKSKKGMDYVLNYYEEFIKEFLPTRNDRERTKFWSTIREDYEFFTNLAMSQKDKKPKLLGQVYDDVLQNKTLLLNASTIKARNKILNSGDSLLIQRFNTWIDKKDLLVKALAMNPDQLKADSIDLKKLEQEIEDLERGLTMVEGKKGNQKTESAWKSISKTLSENERAIEMIRYRYFDGAVFTDSIIYAGLVLKKNATKPEVIIIPNGNLLETDYMGIYRNSIVYEIEDLDSYFNFWQPIEKNIPKGTRIYFSPDGVYSQLNLETMKDDAGVFVLDKNEIFLVGTTKNIISGKKSQVSSQEIVVMGNPIFYKDLKQEEYNLIGKRKISQLPGTAEEVKKVQKISGTSDIFTTLAATEDQVRSLKSPKVFHVATHGFFLANEDISVSNELDAKRLVNNPLLRSGILLSYAGDLMTENNPYNFNKEDGILTAYEAMVLNLDDTELVVLSACETGKGDLNVGDGVYGLQRAFLGAGAKSLIMSLFKVDDAATQRLMELFYENWIQKKMDKREAFIEAKKSLRQEYNEPKYWGAFIMVGA